MEMVDVELEVEVVDASALLCMDFIGRFVIMGTAVPGFTSTWIR